MRSPLPMIGRLAARVLLAGALMSCDTGGGDGGGGGGGGGFAGVWRYPEGAYSFVNCFIDSRRVDLTRTGFQIVAEGDALVRVNPDGCRFTVVPSTPRHAEGVAGEQCTVHTDDGLGGALTVRYTLESLVMEIDAGDDKRLIEVFFLEALNSSAMGTWECEISGSNTVDRVP